MGQFILIFYCMMFCHTFADYNLQGCLANLKQKEYWKDFDTICKNDYKMALFMHSFAWTFMVLLIPSLYIVLSNKAILNITEFIQLYSAIFILNCVAHYNIDDLKANKKSINLVVDQVFHIIQIICSCIIFYSYNANLK